MLDIEKSDKEYLNLFYNIKEKYSDIEFEVIFGSVAKTLGGNNNAITQSRFINLLKKIKNNIGTDTSNWIKIDNNTSLDIFIHKGSTTNDKFNLRFTLNGANNISEFCKTNDLTNLDFDIMP